MKAYRWGREVVSVPDSPIVFELPELRVRREGLVEAAHLPGVSSKHKEDNPSRRTHSGDDVMFRRLAGDTQRNRGDGAGARRWVLPSNVPALAIAAGVVTRAGRIGTGLRVVVRHKGGWSSGYYHLERLAVSVGDRVGAGQPVGAVGDNPAGTDPRHIHTNVWFRGKKQNPRRFRPRDAPRAVLAPKPVPVPDAKVSVPRQPLAGSSVPGRGPGASASTVLSPGPLFEPLRR